MKKDWEGCTLGRDARMDDELEATTSVQSTKTISQSLVGPMKMNEMKAPR